MDLLAWKKFLELFVENQKVKARLKRKRYLTKHPDKIKAQRKRRYLRKVAAGEWKRPSREKENARWMARYWRNPQVKLRSLFRSRIRTCLTKTSTPRCARSVELLGCSVDEARQHIETKFQAGMAWTNHGTAWHVDHIRPCASFDLTDPVQQRACFHYTNLQPLWAIDNLIKGASWKI